MTLLWARYYIAETPPDVSLTDVEWTGTEAVTERHARILSGRARMYNLSDVWVGWQTHPDGPIMPCGVRRHGFRWEDIEP
jgi:hypothetical protein